MGQTSSQSAAEDSTLPSKTHYELLDVPPTASDEDIKKAYRRKALELHPDRNFGKEEAATALFSEIQAAYSVLSDPQERAWYDAHQAEFLSGGVDGGGEEAHYERSVKVTTAEDIRAMCGSRSSAFSDFSDGPNGFFTNVRELFERLAMEEGISSSNLGWEPLDYPSFGSSKDEFQDVVKSFYSIWGSFSTAKTFAWKDLYRPSADYDRRTRRAMEKENQKAREEAIREFNDAVRALVLFVRRRDPRYIPTATTDEERQKTLRDAAAAQAARARKANAEKFAEQAVPDWARSRGDQEEDDYASEEDEENETEEEEEESEVWECVVCSKTFKSEGQYDAHERSKKHKQAVTRLKREMRNQNIELDLESAHKQATAPESDGGDSMDDLNTDFEERLEVNDTNDIQSQHSTEKDPEINVKSTPTDATQEISSPKSSSDSEELDDSYAPRSDIESRILDKSTGTTESSNGLSTPLTYDSDEETSIGKTKPSSASAKLGKAKAKRAKKAAKEQAVKSTPNDADSDELACVACHEIFGSKNKLFDHIKKTGHARPVPEHGNKGNKKGRSR